VHSQSGTAIGLLSFSRDAENDFATGGGIHAEPGRSKTTLLQKLKNLKYLGKSSRQFLLHV
jgi:hypothetical protein